MDLWHLVLFAAASVFALRSFVALTNHHQRYTLQRLLRERQETAGGPPVVSSQSSKAA
jgi:hypothetical protein